MKSSWCQNPTRTYSWTISPGPRVSPGTAPPDGTLLSPPAAGATHRMGSAQERDTHPIRQHLEKRLLLIFLSLISAPSLGSFFLPAHLIFPCPFTWSPSSGSTSLTRLSTAPKVSVLCPGLFRTGYKRWSKCHSKQELSERLVEPDWGRLDPTKDRAAQGHTDSESGSKPPFKFFH